MQTVKISVGFDKRKSHQQHFKLCRTLAFPQFAISRKATKGYHSRASKGFVPGKEISVFSGEGHKEIFQGGQQWRNNF